MPKKIKIAIIVPAANEEDTIKDFCRELLTYGKVITASVTIYFVIDTVSTDNTLQIIKKISSKHPEIKVLYAPENKCLADAYVCGYKEAIKNKFDYIIEMDCGFSHLPSELHQFTDALDKGYDCVFGIRPLWSFSYPAPLKRRIYSLGGTLLANTLLGTKLQDMTSGYEAFTLNAAKKIFRTKLKSTGHFFQTEVRYRARKMNYFQTPIHYSFPSPRVKTDSLVNSFETLFHLFWSRMRRRDS